jgi:hypothetical protein
MNGSAASGAPEKAGQAEAVVNLGTARKMLPLVMRIVNDILELQQRLALMEPEQARLDRQRRTLDWPQRSRRYQLRDDLVAMEESLRVARTELEQLSVVLLDSQKGRVGLPTVVNGHLAYFSWVPGDEGLRHWHFAGETLRRPIPANWKETGEVRLLGKS